MEKSEKLWSRNFVLIIVINFLVFMNHIMLLSNTSTATIVSDVIPRSRFSEGMGMFGMATALATSCAPALGLYLMNSFSYTVLFLCAAGPLTRLIFRGVCRRNIQLKSVEDSI